MATGMGSSLTVPIAPALEREVSAGDNTRKSPIINTVQPGFQKSQLQRAITVGEQCEDC